MILPVISFQAAEAAPAAGLAHAACARVFSPVSVTLFQEILGGVFLHSGKGTQCCSELLSANHPCPGRAAMTPLNAV